MTPESHQERLGIINSSTFGIYFSDVMDRLNDQFFVRRFDVDPDVDGRKLARKLEEFEYLIVSVTPRFTRTFFNNQTDLKLLARHGIGYDNVDIDAATEAGVLVSRVDGIYERNAVAELTISLVLSCLRHVPAADRAVQDREWSRRREFIGGELSRKTLGIIGFGNIGSRVAEIASEGFGASVLTYDPSPEVQITGENDVERVDFKELIQNSDIISINASLNPTSRTLIGESEFRRMKDGIILVNTARGELIDEEALIQALNSEKVAAAGLDVVQREPIPADHPLLDRDNVLVVPHVGSYTRHSLRRMDENSVCDVERVRSGKLPDQLVNPSVLDNQPRADLQR